MSAFRDSTVSTPVPTGKSRNLTSLLRRKWNSFRRGGDCIDEAIASICETLERRVLMSGDSALLSWQWNAGTTDGGGTWSGSQQDRKIVTGSPTHWTTTAISPRDSYRISAGTLTLSGTNLANMQSGDYQFSTELLLINNDPQSVIDGKVKWTITVSSTGSNGSSVTTTETKTLRGEDGQITAGVDGDLEFNNSLDPTHICRTSVSDVGYSASVKFPNYSATNTVTIKIDVQTLKNVTLGTGMDAPPAASWGVDNASIDTVDDCGCGGANGNGNLTYTPSNSISSAANGRGLAPGPNWGSGNQFSGGGSPNGNGIIDSIAPSLKSIGAYSIKAVSGRGGTLYFDDLADSGTNFINRQGTSDNIVHDDTGHTSTLTSSDGSKAVYNDFSTNIATALQGKVLSVSSPYGDTTYTTTTYDYASGTNLSTVTRSTLDGTGAVVNEQLVYNYVGGTGVNSAKIDNVLLQRSVGGSGYGKWRETKYRYYDGSSPALTNAASTDYGNSGDLMSVQTLDATTTNLAVIDTTYMRYFTSTGSAQYVGGLEYTVGPKSYARMLGAGLNPLTSAVSSSNVATYADHYFEYNPTSHQISKQILQGEGASGQGTHTYSYGYHNSTNSVTLGDGHGAAWARRTDETLPDGTIDRTYYDGLGDSIMTITIDGSGNQWGTYYVRDANENVLATYNHSSFSTLPSQSTLEANPDLLNFANGRSFYLNPNSGLVNYTDYFSGTTSSSINETTSGDIQGYAMDQAVGRGVLSLPVNVSSITRSGTNATVTTAAAHGYSVGEKVTIAGADQSNYDGTFSILTVGSSTTFTYQIVDPGVNATGTITAVEPTTIVSSQKYYRRGDGVVTFIYPVASQTQYPNADGTNPRVTNYAYSWASGLQMLSKTITKPPIVTGQNGPATNTTDATLGHTDVSTTIFDNYGRPIWTKDGDNFVNYTAYDAQTGAVIESITDVDYTKLSSGEKSLYDATGWATNSGGVHLVTTDLVDGDGRPTKITDPNGNVTYNVYNDTNHETRTYVGWHLISGSGTNSLYNTTGPVQINREFRPSNTNSAAYVYQESITAAILSHTGAPTGSEDFTSGGTVGGSIQTLSRNYTNNGNQVVRSDQYLTLGTGTNAVTYSTNAYIGSVNVNYYTTTYGFDSEGRQNRIVNPLSTISRTVYDNLGRVVSTWSGTNDTPGSGAWSITNPAGMTELQHNYYDTYDPSTVGIGDGNLTRTVAYPTGTNGLRVTESYYDYRDRMVATKSGVLLDANNRYENHASETDSVHRPIIYYTYDNLNEVTKTEQFDGDGITLTGTNHAVLLTAGVPSPITSTALRARTTVSFDDQGRPYRTDQYDVYQYGTNAGTLATTNTLSTQSFYDHRGNVMASSQPGGLVGKYVYDGAGRLTKQSMSEGGILANPTTWNTWSNASTGTNDVIVQQMENKYDADSNVILTTTRQRFHDDATNGAGLGSLGDRTTNAKARVSYQAFFYDAANRLTDSVDVGTNGTNGAYSRLVTDTAPTNSTAILHLNHAVYSDAGWADTTTDARGIKGKTFYDMLGRTTRSVAAWDGTTDETPSTHPTPTVGSSSNQVIDYGYDGSGHLVLQTAWNKSGTNSATFQSTAYIYGVSTSTSSVNSNDILAKVQYPDTSSGSPGSGTNYSVVYSYNALGQSTIMTDRTGTTHTYGYDPLGRKTSDTATVLGTGVDNVIRRIGFEYDTGGRIYQTTSYKDVSGTNAATQVRDQYNGFGQLTREDQSVGGPIGGSNSTYGTIQYAYNEMSDGKNNSRQLNITYPGMRQITYDYNAGLDNAIGRTSALGEGTGTNHVVVEGYSYLGIGTIVERTRPQESAKQSYVQQTGDSSYVNDGGDQYTGLDRFGRVTDQWWFKTASGTVSATIDRFQYGYDQDGNVLYQKNLGPGTAAASFSELYHANSSVSGDNATAYDNLNRLTGFRRGTLSASANNGGVLDTVTTLNGNTNAAGSQSWNLDVQGNTATLTTNGTAQNRTTDQQNELKTLTTGTNVTTLTYDYNGSLTKDEQGRVLTYDAWGRLATAHNLTTGDQDLYTYDGVSRAAGDIRQITGLGQLQRVSYFSKDWQPIEVRDFVFDTTSPLYTSVYGLGYIDDLVERNQYYDSLTGDAMNDRLWVQQDQNHNVTSIANDSAVVQERFVYDPYKKFTVLDANWVNAVDAKDWASLGQGMRWEKEAGLYEDRNRFYSPSLQRFVSQDPAGTVDGASLYQLERSGPTVAVDPSGLWSLRRNHGATAIAQASVGGDSTENLASATGLDPSEAKKWMSPYVASKDVFQCLEVQVPNKVYVVTGDLSGIITGNFANSAAGFFFQNMVAQGYDVVFEPDGNLVNFFTMLGDSCIQGAYISAHGGKGYIYDPSGKDKNVLTSNALKPFLHHKLAFLTLAVCDAGTDPNWTSLVSSNGTLRASVGNVPAQTTWPNIPIVPIPPRMPPTPIAPPPIRSGP